MTRDDIIRMAREAGFCTLLPSEHIDGAGGIYVGDDDITDSLKRLTALVAAAEREACAMEADYEAARWAYSPEAREPCEEVAKAIRARGQE